MNLTERWSYVLALICYAPLPILQSSAQAPEQQSSPTRVQTVLSHPLPSLDGSHLSVQVAGSVRSWAVFATAQPSLPRRRLCSGGRSAHAGARQLFLSARTDHYL
ncbi:MAG TPA: hypothetical protein VFS41_02830 [Edaphobacter sp.]|nr:hypothetical protein [Edaphobacter sp.]